jgi:hypothetical protein
MPWRSPSTCDRLTSYSGLAEKQILSESAYRYWGGKTWSTRETASLLTGPWSGQQVVVCGKDFPALYGNFMHPWSPGTAPSAPWRLSGRGGLDKTDLGHSGKNKRLPPRLDRAPSAPTERCRAPLSPVPAVRMGADSGQQHRDEPGQQRHGRGRIGRAGTAGQHHLADPQSQIKRAVDLPLLVPRLLAHRSIAVRHSAPSTYLTD